MNTLNGTYKIGEPSDYSSIYGYQKRRFPVIDAASGNQVGYVKEEPVLNGDGTESTRMVYTRNISRPTNAKRFYASPEALVEAFGGKIYRTVVELPTLVVEAEGDTGGKSRSPSPSSAPRTRPPKSPPPKPRKPSSWKRRPLARLSAWRRSRRRTPRSPRPPSPRRTSESFRNTSDVCNQLQINARNVNLLASTRSEPKWIG